MASGTLVLDTRSGGDRIREGTIAGSFHVPLSVLLWRVDPEADCSDPQINDLDAPLVIVCNDGYSSSWAAATLVDLGFSNPMDLAGGFRAWSAAGLPVVRIA
jgi:rhodanese-related sulfurtransferase